LYQLTGVIQLTAWGGLGVYLLWRGGVSLRGLGLDRDPELKSMVFGNYEALMYLRQVPNPRLAEKAEKIAEYLGLPLEIVDVGLGELEDRLAELVEA